MTTQHTSQMPSTGPPRMAIPGGVPTRGTDIPVSVVFLALYAILAVIHMDTFRRNRARGRLFVFSAVTFGFCMSRIVTFSVRIAWVNYPMNKDLAIAAQVFVAAGVVLLYIVNLVFAQRILGAMHPNSGTNRPVRWGFAAYYCTILPVLIMVIVATVEAFTNSNPDTLRITADIRKFGGTWFAVLAFAPIPVTLISLMIPTQAQPKPLGTGSLTIKITMVIGTSVLLTLGAAFRIAISYLPPRLASDPAWYHGRAAFYAFTPMLEVMVVAMLAALRMDKRFYLEGKAERRAAENNPAETEKP
ncbi:hypothetical protein BDZ91DRAFT_710261 [Kalaharituber pfeilii]|nr:hypothetical protein BDZ91DRAFT_710261 [Kalaharituber pfeilii]